MAESKTEGPCMLAKADADGNVPAHDVAVFEVGIFKLRLCPRHAKALARQLLAHAGHLTRNC